MLAGVWEGEPEREHDGQQHEVDDGLGEGVGGDPYVEGFGLHLLKVGVVGSLDLHPWLLKQQGAVHAV